MDQHSNSYTYDAEGRILTGGSGSYVYDGAGNRVKKTVPGAVTLYWHGAGSVLLDGSAATFAKQVNFAGLRVWSESVTSGGRFLFQDHLGSTRVTGDAAGNPGDDIDYLPFGTTAANYGTSSSNHYTFTGYESDQSESSTDYAIFRNSNTDMGRFNRPDPYDGSYDWTNPQSFNRYSYVLNNPLNYIDAFGLEPACFWGNEDGEGWDDTPENGGASETECINQGGTWREVPGPTVTVTVNGGNSGGPTVVIFWINGQFYSSGGVGGGVGYSRGGALSNGPTWSQENKDCLDKINATPDGKFYNFFSYTSSLIGPDASGLAVAQDAASEAAQRGGQRFLSAAAKNWGRTALGSGSGFVGGVWEAVDGFALTPLAVAATAGQLTVHAGCAISAAF